MEYSTEVIWGKRDGYFLARERRTGREDTTGFMMIFYLPDVCLGSVLYIYTPVVCHTNLICLVSISPQNLPLSCGRNIAFLPMVLQDMFFQMVTLAPCLRPRPRSMTHLQGAHVSIAIPLLCADPSHNFGTSPAFVTRSPLTAHPLIRRPNEGDARGRTGGYG